MIKFQILWGVVRIEDFRAILKLSSNPRKILFWRSSESLQGWGFDWKILAKGKGFVWKAITEGILSNLGLSKKFFGYSLQIIQKMYFRGKFFLLGH